MLGKKKKLKIEFVSEMKGVADMFPILEASQYKRKWVASAMADYKKSHKDNDRQSYFVRCPGAFALFRKGYILTAWYDVSIITKKGEEGFAWKLPIQGKLEAELGGNPIEAQPDSIAKWIPKRTGQISSLVKINSPLHVIAPKGVKLLFLPVPYPEQFDFESSMGILDPSESTELNVQLHWYKEDGEVIIKAGTPLMYMLPLYDGAEDIEVNTRDANGKELEFLKTVDYFHTFSFEPYKYRNKIKKLYKRFFHD
tara:strand:- start:2195 stop:2956 length:762 start_codon:yes stop_codon:yes gene_type:complete